MGIYSVSLVRLRVPERRFFILCIPWADLYKLWCVVPGTFSSPASYTYRWQTFHSYLYNYKGIYLRSV